MNFAVLIIPILFEYLKCIWKLAAPDLHMSFGITSNRCQARSVFRTSIWKAIWDSFRRYGQWWLIADSTNHYLRWLLAPDEKDYQIANQPILAENFKWKNKTRIIKIEDYFNSYIFFHINERVYIFKHLIHIIHIKVMIIIFVNWELFKNISNYYICRNSFKNINNRKLMDKTMII